MKEKKSEKDEPASYGTVGAHLGLGSMSRTGREGEHGSSHEKTMKAIEEDEE